MADTQVTAFAALTGGNLAVGDLFPVIDISAAGALKNSIITSAELIVGLKALGSFAALTANTFTGQQINSTAGAASTPPLILTGTWYSGGTATTTKPQLLVEPSGTTSTGWVTGGTGIGINAASGFTGSFLEAKIAGTRYLTIKYGGSTNITQIIGATGGYLEFGTNDTSYFRITANTFYSVGGTGGIGPSYDALFYKKTGTTAIQMGPDAAGVTNQMLTAASRITSDGVGANLTIAGGNGRGGAGGDLIFASYTTAAAATIGTLTTRWLLDAASGALLPGASATYNIGSPSAVCANVYSTDYYSGSIKILGAQGAAVADASGGATVDAEARTAVNDLLARLRTHGLIAT